MGARRKCRYVPATARYQARIITVPATPEVTDCGPDATPQNRVTRPAFGDTAQRGQALCADTVLSEL